jgi:integrase
VRGLEPGVLLVVGADSRGLRRAQDVQHAGRDGLDHRLTKYIDIATQHCPIREKHITPHTLRHTAAMQLRHAGNDITVIALWLGHEQITTTQIYLPCAARRPVVSPAQPGGTRRRVPGSNG